MINKLLTFRSNSARPFIHGMSYQHRELRRTLFLVEKHCPGQDRDVNCEVLSHCEGHDEGVGVVGLSGGH